MIFLRLVLLMGWALSSAQAAGPLDCLGVNTHLNSKWDTAYSDCANGATSPVGGNACPASIERIAAALDYIGITHIRDALPHRYVLDRFLALRDRVPSLRLLPSLSDTPDLAGQLDLLHQAAPFLDGIEGPNESNNRPFRYKNQLFPEAIRTEMRELRAITRRDPALAHIPIVAPSLSGDTMAATARLGDLAGNVDLDNAHAYYGRSPPRDFRQALAAVRGRSTGRPVVVTETGNCTSTGTAPWCGVSEEVQAQYELNAFADALALRLPRLYFYELVDEAPDRDDSEPERHFGLFRFDWSPKPVATALHRLSQWLPLLPVFTSPPRLTVAGVRSVQLTDDMVLVWTEAELWDVAANRSIIAATTEAKLHFKSPARILRISDPLGGTRTGIPLVGRQDITLNIPSYPVLIEVDPDRSRVPARMQSSPTARK